jgi:hypothetical protein
MHLPLVVPGEAQGFPAQLSECPLHDPPLRHDLESIGLLIALDDLKLPRSLLQALRCPLRPLPRAPADPQGGGGSRRSLLLPLNYLAPR